MNNRLVNVSGEQEHEELTEDNSNIAVKNNIAPPEELWFHGKLDRKRAEMRLVSDGRKGCYLIRESEKNAGSYVLSFLSETACHFKIEANCGDYIMGTKQFASITDLVTYYTSASCIIESEYLKFPVPPAEPVAFKKKMKAILPYVKVPDTDELSFLKGDIFVIHSGLDGGWYWATCERTSESGLVFVDLVQDYDETLGKFVDKEWFSSQLTKKKCIEALSSAPPGTFVVRPSESNPDSFSLWVRTSTSIQRFMIERHRDNDLSSFIIGGRAFDALDDVIHHYCNAEIIENLTLISPLRITPFTEEREAEIYNSLTRSGSASALVSGEGSIKKCGYLNKKAKAGFGWKSFYTVLNMSRQRLFFFESQVRKKPKAMICLQMCKVYPVHESLFERPNTIQIVLNAHNGTQTYYISCDSEADLKDWEDALTSSCLGPFANPNRFLIDNLNPERAGQVRDMASVYMQLKDIKEVPMPPATHVQLFFDQAPYARLPIGSDAYVWYGHMFKVKSLPQYIKSIKIALVNKAKRGSPRCNELGHATIELSSLADGELQDSWRPFTSNRNQCGRFRFSLLYKTHIMLPLDEYKTLATMVCCKDHLIIIRTLSEIFRVNLPYFSSLILKIHYPLRMHLDLIVACLKSEIEEEEDPTILLRANSLATTLFEQYMRMVSIEYLRETVQPVIDSLLLHPSDHPDNVVFLLEKLVEKIFTSIHFCHRNVRFLLAELKKMVEQRWPENRSLSCKAVANFFFLRFVCTALINPPLYSLQVGVVPIPHVLDSLKVLAKALQCLANMTQMKDYPEQDAINVYLDNNKERMTHFLAGVSTCPEGIVLDENRDFNITEKLSSLHLLCHRNWSQLQQSSIQQCSLKKLVAVVEMLNQQLRPYSARHASPGRL